MKRYSIYSLIILSVVFCSFYSKNNNTVLDAHAVAKDTYSQEEPKVYRYGAEAAEINVQSTEIVADERLSNKKGITLKSGTNSAINGERAAPDLVFNIKVPDGRYVMSTYAETDTEGAKLMEKAKTKFESLYLKIQVGNRKPTKRVVYVPWNVKRQESGKFEFKPGEQLKIWLPRGVRLEYVELTKYIPPAIPVEAQTYKPRIIPPSNHPRLWVNQQSLPVVKARLQSGENLVAWKKVEKSALKPFIFKFNPDEELPYNGTLEEAAEKKAFYYLMTGDKQVGREAVKLMTDYLSHVEFGNILDVTRQLGHAIYSASEVYDWCYNIMTPKEKQILYENLMRLADDMECGWPPFNQSIINGHGNEAQINRDLLSMSIAVYNENPVPYQYTSYLVLEKLVPMRKFEYQSPRHNQGVNYGSYRFGWEMHAAWLFYRMTGHPVFDDNIKNVRKFWQYMRIPDGQMLRDGDGFTGGTPGEFYYWKAAQTMFMNYTYAADPVLKGEFERQGGLPDNPVLFLLLNDPGMKADLSMKSLPLTMGFGPVLGSMIARTGWDIGMSSNDVVAEIKGGGYHFTNHQHADAGSIQLYYRGFQFGDIGVYHFYGTPYDFNFNKRSVAHSMMLAVDPKEKYPRSEANDGGTRFNLKFPETPEEIQTNPLFNNGKVISSDFGPSKLRPFFSYFNVNLTGAYSSKMKDYGRGFCFLNLDRKDVPAAIILTDDMTTTRPEFKKYWQINAHNLPEKTAKGFVLHNNRGKLVGKTYIEMLLPAAADRSLEILSGQDATSVFNSRYETPSAIQYPETKGHRVMISPKNTGTRDRFLTVFQMTSDDTKPLPVSFYETSQSYVITISDRMVSLSNTTAFIDKGFTLKVPNDKKYQVALVGMKPGQWNIKGRRGKVNYNADVKSGKNTIFFLADGGEFVITPGRQRGAVVLPVNENYQPAADK
jgi:heparin/heparan-sulfate lyase